MVIAPSPALSFASNSDGGCEAAVLLAVSPAAAEADSPPSSRPFGAGTIEGMRELASSVSINRAQRYWTAIRRSHAGRRSLFLIAFSCLVYLVYHGIPARATSKPLHEPAQVSAVEQWREAPAPTHHGIARVSAGSKETFLQYLDAHFPLSRQRGTSPPPHLWITLAEARYVRTGVANLDLFVRQLNSERRAKYGPSKPETRLIVLCLDDECLYECGARGMYAYGGYERLRPPQVMRATWPKVSAFIDILPHRDVFFVDADVSFRA